MRPNDRKNAFFAARSRCADFCCADFRILRRFQVENSGDGWSSRVFFPARQGCEFARSLAADTLAETCMETIRPQITGQDGKFAFLLSESPDSISVNTHT